jgi:cytochrome c556
MRMKLDHAQRALEGLAVEDFDMLEDAAEGMSLMSLASHWNVLQTQEYLDQSSEFRRAAESLKRAAEDNNLEGATLAYIEVTMSCVKCHKYMREMQLARADFGSP